MAVRDVFKVSRKTFFNPSAWLDVETLKEQNAVIKTILKNLFSIDQAVSKETFEQAMKRLRLTEKDVKEGIKTYRTYALIFALCGLLAFFYAFFLLFAYATFIGFILSLGVAALFFSQAFKYDFWSFQMRKRKLGITGSEWLKELLGGKGSK